MKDFDKGGIWAIAEKRAVSVTPGEPAAELFLVPASSPEVQPSVLVEEAAKNENVPVMEPMREHLSRLDEAYHRSRRSRGEN